MNLQLVYRYILSLSKNENMFYEKNTKQTKGPQNKKKEMSVSDGESRTRDHWRIGWTRYLSPRKPTLSTTVVKSLN